MNNPHEAPQTLIERAAAWLAGQHDDAQQDALDEANAARPAEDGYDVDAAGNYTE